MSNCSICLDTPKEPFVSQCGHSFCNKCILQWIMQHDECPLCRNSISAPSRNTIVYDEDVPNSYKFYLEKDITLTLHETNIIQTIINDFIEYFEDIESYSKYKWKDTNEGYYLVTRYGDYYFDYIFKVYKHNYITNCYVINARITKRLMKKQYQKQQKKIKFNKRINSNYLCK